MVLVIALILVFVCILLLVFGFSANNQSERPSLKLQDLNAAGLGPSTGIKTVPKKADAVFFLNSASIVTRPMMGPGLRQRILKDLSVGHVELSPEAFLLIKIILMLVCWVVGVRVAGQEMIVFVFLMGLALGYYGPEFWLKMKIGQVKSDFGKFLPDTVDLLGLCVSAGLDFMMSLKWVVDKSPNNVVTQEMQVLLQEISVGKPRRDALRDMARKYELPDLSTFSRTLIQADKMGTSVSEALAILSEDMRLARFRRGEAIALKAPLKMLVPLLFFIFPCVGILVGGPIFLDFVVNNPIQKL